MAVMEPIRVMQQEAFDALADPTRRQILQYLSTRDEATAGELARQIGNLGRTAVSSHLRVLRTSSLIVERRSGRFRYYSMDAHGPMRHVLTFLEGLLGSGLETLTAGADSAKPSAAGGERLRRSTG